MKNIDVDASADLRGPEPLVLGGEKKRRWRLVVNITPHERVGRVVVGAIGAVGGALLIASTGGVLPTLLAGLLVLAGLDLVITGALGHCPLYRKLGYVPPSLRGPA